MDLGLRGKTALITGGSKGIGRAAAESLAAEGCHVILVARTEAALAAAAKEIRSRFQVNVRAHAADIAVQGTAEALAGLFPEIDILVNNAGAIPGGSLQQVDGTTWREAWKLKVFGYIDMCRAFYPLLTHRGGVIVNVIGNAAATLDQAYICSVAGNAALEAFTRSLGGGAPADGMRVVGLSPGPVATDRLLTLTRRKAAEQFGDAERWRELLATMPFGRPATPQEIGDMVAFLASPRSGYTSGTIVQIDGGMASRSRTF
jgi:NAD(P)-dependent dehydrogenase (short-subunit alcohol dehydrogenase family)